MRVSFCVLVVLLAVFQFSENTVDPDLWGHVVFGQEMIRDGTIPKAEIYSWTAHGQPWINHEVLAEICLGAAHSWLGGSGILLLKLVVGLLTFAVGLRLGLAGLSWPARYFAWALGALAVVEVSYGFAARPQIFTALFLVIELWLLRRIHQGGLRWAFCLPLLFVVWINTHGGALAGIGLLGLATSVSTFQWMFRKQSSEPKRILVLCLSFIGSVVALFCNPWKAELVRWLVDSVLWLRPQIQEWNPTPFGWNHAAFFILLVLTILAWLFTRRQRQWWEAVACAVFALLALRSTRNSPLFCLVALALVPTHLGNALERFKYLFERLITVGRQPGAQKLAAVLFVTGATGIAVATLTLHKEHPLTMEVPRSQYPVQAIEFIREQGLSGKTITFFDWGEMVIFHLPECSPSIDGRLDTCYPRELIAAHWKFYNNEPFDRSVLNPDEADFALLPSNLAGALSLREQPGWKAVYFDDVAVVLVRRPERFPRLKELSLPVQGEKSLTTGRAAFANASPRWQVE